MDLRRPAIESEEETQQETRDCSCPTPIGILRGNCLNGRYEAVGGESVKTSLMDQQNCAIGSEKRTWERWKAICLHDAPVRS